MAKPRTPKKSDTPKEIFLIDGQTMVREGLASLISAHPKLRVSGGADTGFEAMETIRDDPPDLVLTELNLSGKSGLELIRDIGAFSRDLPILVVSANEESLYAERALRAGARGYIMKQWNHEALIAAIELILAGNIYVSPQMASRLAEGVAGRHHEHSPVRQLTDRQFEVFEMVGHSLTSAEIADRLHLSPKTIETYRSHIKKRLGVTTSAELTCAAARWVEAHSASG